jgi:NAD(P)-dependent dehydrogenase (short-subunit alcohol dehydrogenase family)
MHVHDKSALVSGGASGLGQAVVEKLLENGAHVVIADRDAEKGNALVETLAGQPVEFVRTDVTSEPSVYKAVETALRRNRQLDVLVNCAGIAVAEKIVGKKGVHGLDVFAQVIQVNLVGTFNTLRLASEAMVHNKPGEDGERGVIINTASVAAFEGQIGQAAYAASKGGVAGLTLPAARELARHGIRVVAIAPGLFETPLLASIPEPARQALGESIPYPSRLGHAEEYAALVQHVIENRYLNGEVIRLDGALRMAPR